MNSPALQVGTLVVQPTRPEWGSGKVVKVDGTRAYVVWRDVPDREAKTMIASFLQRAPDQEDDILDNLPPLVEKDGKLLLPKARITFKQAVHTFLSYFPQGFYDPGFLGDSKKKGERFYKEAAHDYYVSVLGGDKFRELLENDLASLVQEVDRCVGKVNMLHMTEAAAFRDALRDEDAARALFVALADLLDAEEISESVVAPYFDAVCSLPAERGPVAKWTVATIIPFLSQPKRYMFLKPEVTKKAAESLGFELNYRTEPNWLTYKSLLRMAEIYGQKLAYLKPRDMIDMQSFFYVACGGYKALGVKSAKSDEARKKEFLAKIKKDGRSSPAGLHWAKFTDLLYEHRKDESDRPPVSLILAASSESNQSKHERLSEQLSWAISRNCLDAALAFLEKLPEESWNNGSLETWNEDYF